MKHEPIQAKHIGCTCCNNVGSMLNKEKWLDVGFGSVDFKINYPTGRSFVRQYVGGLSESEDQVTKVKDILEEYGERFEGAESITLLFNTPLHDETYEFNTVDSEWYLIRQGMGFA